VVFLCRSLFLNQEGFCESFIFLQVSN
jgi:hypothetical protein